jgi:hypothetical protein
MTRSIGWGVLSETPGREVVMGAVTEQWEADVVFRALSPDAFARFAVPGLVKIVWTLRADPETAASSVLMTETRAVATDDESRRRFHRYWTIFSPGIIVIRRIALRLARRDAERRAADRGTAGDRRGTAGKLARNRAPGLPLIGRRAP